MADREADPTTVDRDAPVEPTTSTLDEMITRGRNPAGGQDVEPVTQSGAQTDKLDKEEPEKQDRDEP
ncbi:MAG TPA: hypothetical protein VJX66_32185 [Amycolatopsis sp.]|nr:hypothetical protein [Amycolatopsis sp.]